MSEKPNTPDGWRELLAAHVRDPELTEEERKSRWRDRRRYRKAARVRQRQQTKEAIEAERRREPTTAGGAFVIIVVILALGLMTRCISSGDGDEPAPKASVSASPANTEEPGRSDPSSTPEGEPSPTASEATDLSDPEAVAQKWATAYLTRDPVKDTDHTASVDRASDWMTAELKENLTEHDDHLFNKLVSRGGISEVTTVNVSKSKSGLGADTSLRVWRQLDVRVDVEGYNDYSETHTLQVEVIQQGGGTWAVSRVLGL